MVRVCFERQAKPDRIEVDDDAASARALAENPDATEWEAGAADFFVSVEGGLLDQGTPRLREVFNLEDQLAQLPN